MAKDDTDLAILTSWKMVMNLQSDKALKMINGIQSYSSKVEH